jgi:signal transduction histidine kinase
MFAGRVAHDVLGPMTNVELALGLVARRVEGDELLGQAVEQGRRSGRRVKMLVDGLLDFARSGARPEPGGRTAAGEVIRDVMQSVAQAAEEAQVELAVEPFEPVEVACSPGVFMSCLSNLVRNGIKYMGDGTVRRVTVRVRTAGPRARFEVEDTGPGLPRELAETIFQPYVRGRGSGQPGIGLGLATVRRLADAHGGAAGVSQAPDGGCLFWFEFPKAAAA